MPTNDVYIEPRHLHGTSPNHWVYYIQHYTVKYHQLLYLISFKRLVWITFALIIFIYTTVLPLIWFLLFHLAHVHNIPHPQFTIGPRWQFLQHQHLIFSIKRKTNKYCTSFSFILSCFYLMVLPLYMLAGCTCQNT